jgi:tetratricopeptide (TPR) repeat protein
MRDEIDQEPAPLILDTGITQREMARALQPIVDRGETLRGPDAARHFTEIERRIDTIRAALDAAIVRELDLELGVRALAALSRYFFDRGYSVEALRWYESAIPRLPEASALRAEALYLRAMVGRNLGNAEQNLPAFEQAIAALRRTEETTTLAKAMLYGSNAARMTGRLETAREYAREAYAILERTADTYLIAFARSALGAAAYACGDLATAGFELEEARRGFAAVGAGDDEALMRLDVARCAFAQGELVVAQEGLSRALNWAIGSGNRYVEAHAEVGLTLVALDRADARNARGHAVRAAALSLKLSDTELSVIALEACGELFWALGELARARDALAAADGVRSQYLIARAPTEHARCERLRTELAAKAMLIAGTIATPDVMLRALLESVARSYQTL